MKSLRGAGRALRAVGAGGARAVSSRGARLGSVLKRAILPDRRGGAFGMGARAMAVQLTLRAFCIFRAFRGTLRAACRPAASGTDDATAPRASG
ncbi:hypothetical protein WS68_02460 [Burkholderia sp. TSV86]|nr:hypothetical protein WS68_02460 [Burkholderia sp. TSV86]